MKQAKKTITEAQLRNIVAESVREILKEDRWGKRSVAQQIIAPAYEEMNKAYQRLKQLLYKGNKDPQIDKAERILHDAVWAIKDAGLYAPEFSDMDDEY